MSHYIEKKTHLKSTNFSSNRNSWPKLKSFARFKKKKTARKKKPNLPSKPHSIVKRNWLS